MKIRLDQRIVLEKMKLRNLVFKAKENSQLTWSKLEKKLDIDGSTLRESYLEDNRSISYSLFLKLCKLAKVPKNRHKELIKEVREKNWSKKYAGSIGGKVKKCIAKIKIKKPCISEYLAEFAGIIYGDGYIYRKNYTLQISLGRKADIFYVTYVINLIEKLFGIKPKVHENVSEGVFIVKVNSKELIDFLIDVGILNKMGRKQIPNWILNNFTFLKSLLRGLIDTDGSFYLSSRWCVLGFSSSEPKIRKLVISIFEKINIPVFVSGIKVNATSLWKIKKYLSEVGTSNLKNVIKFLEYTRNGRKVLTNDLKFYAQKYQNINLPYFYKGL